MSPQPWLIIILILLSFCSFELSAKNERIVIENDQWKLIADWQQQTTSQLKGIVLLLHKAAGNRTIYKKMASQLSQQGYASLRIDLRGHGESINKGAFDPTLSRFKNPDNPAISANFKLIEKAYLDIIATIDWLKKNKNTDDVPFLIIGSSYTGEQMVKASEVTGWADLYIALAPGNFSNDSVKKINPSNKPWLFVRAEQEMPFMDGIFDKIKNGSDAEIWVISGKGHATDLFIENDDMEKKLIDWINLKLEKSE